MWVTFVLLYAYWIRLAKYWQDGFLNSSMISGTMSARECISCDMICIYHRQICSILSKFACVCSKLYTLLSKNPSWIVSFFKQIWILSTLWLNKYVDFKIFHLHGFMNNLIKLLRPWRPLAFSTLTDVCYDPLSDALLLAAARGGGAPVSSRIWAAHHFGDLSLNLGFLKSSRYALDTMLNVWPYCDAAKPSQTCVLINIRSCVFCAKSFIDLLVFSPCAIG